MHSIAIPTAGLDCILRVWLLRAHGLSCVLFVLASSASRQPYPCLVNLEYSHRHRRGRLLPYLKTYLLVSMAVLM